MTATGKWEVRYKLNHLDHADQVEKFCGPDLNWAGVEARTYFTTVKTFPGLAYVKLFNPAGEQIDIFRPDGAAP